MPKVTILFFAHARELVDKAEDSIEVDHKMAYEDLKEKIFSKFEPIRGLKTFLIALNHDYLEPGSSVQLKDSDVIAIIPPVGGG
ncbi:Hypothetical protein NTJ_15290 [Nesidiocoris tenuis]|uniref:Molybdopterin synthase sulfur carrier subunit n=1 Tax=Nesidiocoris tenuis TaxID=355587 RepID=A0ABN7BDR2_9HEMI|nr:Hypothetical protein NTJ_15290 [Nesidiocoris tenuis]